MHRASAILYYQSYLDFHISLYHISNVYLYYVYIFHAYYHWPNNLVYCCYSDDQVNRSKPHNGS